MTKTGIGLEDKTISRVDQEGGEFGYKTSIRVLPDTANRIILARMFKIIKRQISLGRFFIDSDGLIL